VVIIWIMRRILFAYANNRAKHCNIYANYSSGNILIRLKSLILDSIYNVCPTGCLAFLEQTRLKFSWNMYSVLSRNPLLFIKTKNVPYYDNGKREDREKNHICVIISVYITNIVWYVLYDYINFVKISVSKKSTSHIKYFLL